MVRTYLQMYGWGQEVTRAPEHALVPTKMPFGRYVTGTPCSVCSQVLSPVSWGPGFQGFDCSSCCRIQSILLA